MIPSDHLESVCQRGQGEKCCRYLGMGPGGWRCLKLTEFRTMLDHRRSEGSIRAMDDNCDGLEHSEAN